MYKKKQKRKKIIIITTISIVVLGLFIYSLVLNRKTTKGENILKSGITYIEKLLINPFTDKELKNIDQSKSYLIQKNVNESLEKEIEELKKELALNSTLTEYSIENATILSRNKTYWFNTLNIDTGKKDGIKKDMAVVTADGLIGSINKVGHNYSEVKLITCNDLAYRVSIVINVGDSDTYAVLSGYDKKKNRIKITGIDKTVNLKKGDKVLTSGLGNKFPRGIFIGEVDKIENDRYNISKTAYVKTTQDFNKIHYVTVLKEKK